MLQEGQNTLNMWAKVLSYDSMAESERFVNLGSVGADFLSPQRQAEVESEDLPIESYALPRQGLGESTNGRRHLQTCETVTSITASTLTDQEYTITDLSKDFTFPPFVTDPPGCSIDYSFFTQASGVIDSFSSPQRKFTIFYKDDLLFCGDTELQYEVQVSGSAGTVTPKGTNAAFILTLKNPCGRSDLVQLESVPLPEDFGYTIRSPPAAFTHQAYQTLTTPYTHSLCDTITYRATSTLNGGQLLTATSQPLRYDSTKRRFTIFSQDQNLIGDVTITLNAHIKGKEWLKAPTQSVNLKLYNPCEQVSVSAPKLPSFIQYSYETIEEPSGVIQFNSGPQDSWAVEPDFCPLSYSCQSPPLSVLGIPGCNFSRGDSKGTFDETTGKVTLTTHDTQLFEPGTSIFFLISGVSGEQKTTKLVVLKLIDPCPTAKLAFRQPTIFDEMMTYSLRSPPLLLNYDSSQLTSLSTLVGCGPVTVSIANGADGTQIDQSLFSSITGQTGGLSGQISTFSVLETENEEAVGTYYFSLSARLADYPLTERAELPGGLRVRIVDPCDEPLSIAPPASLLHSRTIEYSLTAPSLTFTFDRFQQNPDWCEIHYSYALSSIKAELALAAFEQEKRQFTFEYGQADVAPMDDDLEAEFVDYDLAIKAEHGKGKKQSTIAFARVRLWNPCFATSGILLRPMWCPLKEQIEHYQPKMPQWQADLKEMVVFTGSLVARHEFDFGPKVDQYGIKGNLHVAVRLGQAAGFAFYDQVANALIVDKKLTERDLGYYKVEVVTSELKHGQTYTYEKHAYLRVVKGLADPTAGGQSSKEAHQRKGYLTKDRIIRKSDPLGSKPKPHILSLSFTGELTIGWSHQMQAVQADIQKAQLLVYARAQSHQSLGLRELQQRESQIKRIVDVDETDSELEKLMSRTIELKALDVELIDEYGDIKDEKLQPKWSIANSDASKLVLQLEISDVQQLEQGDQISVTFWDTQFFKDSEGNRVPFGTELRWELFRQVQPSQLSYLDDIKACAFALLAMTAFFTLMLLTGSGPLLTVWMSINSLQLITHVPMISTNFPGTANWFILQHLSIMQMNQGPLETWLSEQFADTSFSDALLARDPDARFYTALLQSCGYSSSLWPNLKVLVFILICIALVWLMSLGVDLINKWRGKPSFYESQMNNFTFRFMYETFFEVVICTMINISIQSQDQPSPSKIASMILVITIAACSLLAMMYYLKSTLHSKVYERRTIADFCGWSYRPLKKDQIEKFQLTSQKAKPLDKVIVPKLNLQKVEIYRKSENSVAVDRLSDIQSVSERSSGSLSLDYDAKPNGRNVSMGQRGKIEEELGQKLPIRVAADYLGDSLRYSVQENIQEVRRTEPQTMQSYIEYEGGEPEVLQTARTERQLLETQQATNCSMEISPRKIEREQVVDKKVMMKAKLVQEARIRVILQSATNVDKRFSTFSNGLRKNHPHNVTLLYPLAFILRRVSYAALVIFLTQVPIVASCTLCLVCLAMIAFTVVEKQWEDSMISWQHIVNETALYLILLAALACSLPLEPEANAALSWTIIAFILATMIFNLAIIAHGAITHCKKGMRLRQYKRSKSQRKKNQTSRSRVKRRHFTRPYSPGDPPATARDTARPLVATLQREGDLESGLMTIPLQTLNLKIVEKSKLLQQEHFAKIPLPKVPDSLDQAQNDISACDEEGLLAGKQTLQQIDTFSSPTRIMSGAPAPVIPLRLDLINADRSIHFDNNDGSCKVVKVMSNSKESLNEQGGDNEDPRAFQDQPSFPTVVNPDQSMKTVVAAPEEAKIESVPCCLESSIATETQDADCYTQSAYLISTQRMMKRQSQECIREKSQELSQAGSPSMGTGHHLMVMKVDSGDMSKQSCDAGDQTIGQVTSEINQTAGQVEPSHDLSTFARELLGQIGKKPTAEGQRNLTQADSHSQGSSQEEASKMSASQDTVIIDMDQQTQLEITNMTIASLEQPQSVAETDRVQSNVTEQPAASQVAKECPNEISREPSVRLPGHIASTSSLESAFNHNPQDLIQKMTRNLVNRTTSQLQKARQEISVHEMGQLLDPHPQQQNQSYILTVNQSHNNTQDCHPEKQRGSPKTCGRERSASKRDSKFEVGFERTMTCLRERELGKLSVTKKIQYAATQRHQKKTSMSKTQKQRDKKDQKGNSEQEKHQGSTKRSYLRGTTLDSFDRKMTSIDIRQQAAIELANQDFVRRAIQGKVNLPTLDNDMRRMLTDLSNRQAHLSNSEVSNFPEGQLPAASLTGSICSIQARDQREPPHLLRSVQSSNSGSAQGDKVYFIGTNHADSNDHAQVANEAAQNLQNRRLRSQIFMNREPAIENPAQDQDSGQALGTAALPALQARGLNRAKTQMERVQSNAQQATLPKARADFAHIQKLEQAMNLMSQPGNSNQLQEVKMRFLHDNLESPKLVTKQNSLQAFKQSTGRMLYPGLRQHANLGANPSGAATAMNRQKRSLGNLLEPVLKNTYKLLNQKLQSEIEKQANSLSPRNVYLERSRTVQLTSPPHQKEEPESARSIRLGLSDLRAPKLPPVPGNGSNKLNKSVAGSQQDFKSPRSDRLLELRSQASSRAHEIDHFGRGLSSKHAQEAQREACTFSSALIDRTLKYQKEGNVPQTNRSQQVIRQTRQGLNGKRCRQRLPEIKENLSSVRLGDQSAKTCQIFKDPFQVHAVSKGSMLGQAQTTRNNQQQSLAQAERQRFLDKTLYSLQLIEQMQSGSHVDVCSSFTGRSQHSGKYSRSASNTCSELQLHQRRNKNDEVSQNSSVHVDTPRVMEDLRYSNRTGFREGILFPIAKKTNPPAQLPKRKSTENRVDMQQRQQQPQPVHGHSASKATQNS